MVMAEMEKIIEKSFQESIRAKKQSLERNSQELIEAATMIVDAFHDGCKLMIFGNGGSAADAQHMAAEFVNRFVIERPSLPALALTTDTSVLTSISNDYSFDEVFSKQIKALGMEGDIAWGISTSGASANVLQALVSARDRRLRTIGMTGRGGSRMAEVSDVLITVDASDTARIQECHITMGHIIIELVDYQLFQRLVGQ